MTGRPRTSTMVLSGLFVALLPVDLLAHGHAVPLGAAVLAVTAWHVAFCCGPLHVTGALTPATTGPAMSPRARGRQ